MTCITIKLLQLLLLSLLLSYAHRQRHELDVMSPCSFSQHYHTFCRCCNDFRFLGDLYAGALLHFIKTSTQQSTDLIDSTSRSSSLPQPASSNIFVPEIITDFPGCSSTITLQHASFHSLCGMARLSYVALFRYGQAHVDCIGVSNRCCL